MHHESKMLLSILSRLDLFTLLDKCIKPTQSKVTDLKMIQHGRVEKKDYIFATKGGNVEK